MDNFQMDRQFLTEEEVKLLQWILLEHEKTFAWTEMERGRFRTDYLPPIKIPTVPHTSWAHKNMPIPPSAREELLKLLKAKIDAGVYEPSNSGYRSRWFCVLKKDGKSLRIVHNLQHLNSLTIKDAGVTPPPEEFAEGCSGFTVLSMFDLFSSYDLQLLDESSRDMTTFQTPIGSLRNVGLPMGWTNAVATQQGNLVHILRPEMPDKAAPFIDDVVTTGPRSFYKDKEGNYETIPGNPKIIKFIWEAAETIHRVLQRLEKAGASVSGKNISKTGLGSESSEPRAGYKQNSNDIDWSIPLGVISTALPPVCLDWQTPVQRPTEQSRSPLVVDPTSTSFSVSSKHKFKHCTNSEAN